MSHRYQVYPVLTVNMPEHHPGVWYQNYELYIGDGEIIDVRTRCHDLGEPEILLAQVIDLDGRVVGQVPFEQIILCDDEEYT